MSTVTAGLVLLLFLPFVVSLFGRAAMPKMLCLVASLIAALLAVKFDIAIVPWLAGMVVAGMSVRELTAARDVLNKKRGGIAPAALNS